MSFQAYLDTIQKKTGKRPEDFRKLAKQRGYLRPGAKAGEIVGWLKSEFLLGHGHAMALYSILRDDIDGPRTQDDELNEHFKGARSQWVDTYQTIIRRASGFGKEKPTIKVGKSYLSLLRNGKKFAIIKPGAEFFDIGIKLKENPPSGRLQKAGDWNAMVSHRIRLASPADLDAEVFAWLKAAYRSANVP